MSTTLAATLKAGLRAHKAGQIDHAIMAYGAILQIVPDHPTARHLRGFALLQLGRAGDAIGDLRTAVAAAPSNAEAWLHLSVCQDQLGEPAAHTARQALVLQPSAHGAIDVLVRHATAPDRMLSYLPVLAPDDPTVWTRIGQARSKRDPDRAIRDLRRAQCLVPAEPSSRLDLADLERRRDRPDLARDLATQSLILRPNDPRGFAERAAAATELDAVVDALADTGRAVLFDPAHTTAWGNRGETWYRMADYPQAVRCGMRAMLTAPSDPGVRANLGAYRLAAGDLAGGWPLFRSRPARRNTHGPGLPRWSGEPAARLLVLAEQGLGDELLFSTLWRALDRQVADGRLAGATIETDSRLLPLGSRALPHLTWRPRMAADTSGTPHTHWCLAGDLMEILRPTVADFTGAGPGLAPDPNRVEHWRDWLARTAAGRPSVGLCWRSGSLAGHRRRHYPTIGDCADLLRREGIFFVVLQYDDCETELAGQPVGPGSQIAFPPDLDRRDDQDGVAALMVALDLVVSADTAVLALAGAIGVPALGITLHPGWVGLGQGAHPWFPRVDRVYRGPDTLWSEALEQVAAKVDAALNTVSRQTSKQ